MRIKLPCLMQTPKILPFGQALQERNNIHQVTILMSMRCHLQSVNNTNGGHTSYWLFVNIFDLGLWSCDFVILAFVLLHCLMALCQHMFWLNVKYLLFWYFWSNMKCIIDIEKSMYPFLCPLWKESLYSDKTITLVYFCFFVFFVFFN